MRFTNKFYLIIPIVLCGITLTAVYGFTNLSNPFSPPYQLEDSTHGNATRIYVNGTGSVGIGTTTPSQKLDVAGNMTLEGNSLLGLNGGVGAGNVNTGWYSDGANLAPRIPSSTGSFYIQTKNGGGTLLAFTPVGTSWSFMDVTGYAHIYGNTKPKVNTQGIYLDWNELNNVTGETDIINSKGTGTGGFAFMNTGSPYSPTTLMFVNGTGFVGMGTTTPSQKLEVNGMIQADGNLTTSSTNKEFKITAPSGVPICIGTGC